MTTSATSGAGCTAELRAANFIDIYVTVRMPCLTEPLILTSLSIISAQVKINDVSEVTSIAVNGSIETKYISVLVRSGIISPQPLFPFGCGY